MAKKKVIKNDSEPRKNKKVCILGTAYSINKTPWDDKSFDFWACASVYANPCAKDKKFDLFFELHDENYFGQPEVTKRLNEINCTILMKEKEPKINKSEKFDFEGLVSFFAGNRGKKYFTSTIAFMLAYAIYKGYEEIQLYGVHMSAAEEYGSQRQACEYWIGIAEGIGIKVYIPHESEILRTPYIYAYETENDIVAQARIRREGLQQGVLDYEARKINKLIELHENIGKNSVCPSDELKAAIQKNGAEIKAIQQQIDKNTGAISEDEHWIRRYSYSGKLFDGKS